MTGGRTGFHVEAATAAAADAGAAYQTPSLVAAGADAQHVSVLSVQPEYSGGESRLTSMRSHKTVLPRSSLASRRLGFDVQEPFPHNANVVSDSPPRPKRNNEYEAQRSGLFYKPQDWADYVAGSLNKRYSRLAAYAPRTRPKMFERNRHRGATAVGST